MSTTQRNVTNRLTTKNKVGLVIAGLLGLADTVALAFPTPDGDVGPPIGILIFGAVCGVVTVIAVVIAFMRASRVAIRVAAGARVLSVMTSLPAFFVDVPPAVKILVAAFVVVTVISVVLMLSAAPRSATVQD
jgi:hypothetical protein